MRIIEEAALREVVTPGVAVRAIREAFRADGEGRTRVPPVINLDVPGVGGEFHVKTALIDGVPHVAIKIASGFPGNASKGLPTGSGMMAVFDRTTGLPSALLLDNGFLTDIRTGAAGAVAADVLAPKSIRTVGVLGSGLQARYQIDCLRIVRDFSRIVAWSPTRSRLESYCAGMRRSGYEMKAAATIEEVCRAADVLITATPSREPLVRADWLHAGQHVTALGSDSPGKQELDAACFRSVDRVAVDRFAQCVAFGETKYALEAGHVRSDAIVELGAIVAGRTPGRTGDAQLTIADLTGVGFQDTAIASAALELAGTNQFSA